MKVTCNRAALYEAVQLADTIVPSRTPKPILLCAKIEADVEQKRLLVTATDNEITVRYVVNQVEVERGGTAVLPADRISGILRESSDDTVELEMVDSTCQIIGKDSKFHIYGHDPEDFPQVAAVEDDGGMEIKAAVLRRMIGQSTFAAARENTRYAINGVFWEQIGKKLRLVATDGRRLAKSETDVKGVEKDSENTAIVPIKTMGVVERVLHDPDEAVRVKFSENQVLIRTGQAEISSTLMQGRFPKYADVIPTGNDKKAQVGKEALQSGVRRVALLINEQSKGIEMAFSEGQLRLVASAPEAGDAEITMTADYHSEDMAIGFNPQFILDMLRVIETDDVVVELSDKTKPGLFRSGKDFLYVVMPVTV